MSTATVFHICDSCVAAIVNDDFSAMEPEEEAIVSEFCERVGYLVDAGTVGGLGYWSCEACGDVQIGSAHAMETIA